ncbi:class I SAM-dependent rRNA methyltransferase [Evansella clarkii]|uniref:class I SAM-dependent rRNA methyltransferase n=1 Tax=Evansella clarkii TaxID=79879 RepID=UPI000B44150C|nr:class I SAM-dependent rRNA methyltransferase [Evansella clarkii]
MRKDVTVRIKNKFGKKYRQGYPLIFKEAIINLDDLKEEGSLVTLTDESGSYLGTGYYGLQNKGFGWVLSRKEKEKIDKTFFEKKIQSALRVRSKFFEDPATTAFRVFNGEGDGIGGFTIDFYDGYYLINWYSEGIYTFKNEVVNSLEKLIDFKGIYEKKRFNTEGKYIEDDDFVTGERGEFPLLVQENGINFATDLNEGAMTGVFLDQRDVRRTIRDKYAQGKTVLNTFSYTGAFSVAAAIGGAAKTTSVDVANRSLQKTIEQFSVNGIDYEAQEIIVEDVFHYFKYAKKKEKKFDLVILDPPSFARTKKVKFSAAKDYKKLLKEAAEITEKGGVIVASTNFSGFGMGKFKQFAEEAFKELGEKYKIAEEFSLPEDFRTVKEYPEGNYLKVLFLQKL